MRAFIAALLLLVSTSAQAIHVVSKPAGVDIDTAKVSRLDGPILEPAQAIFFMDSAYSMGIPGARVIVIDSPGGDTRVGDQIIGLIEAEKAEGVKQICVVKGQASSMAFNILTHCDVRLAVKDAKFVVHKIAIANLFEIRERMTAKHLRDIAAELDADDEQYCRDNAKAMHLSRRNYDKFADQESSWSAQELLDRGYLQGIVKFK